MEQPLICLSHLRWDHVWQRPHHLMSRISQHVPVIFVEEPWMGVWPHVESAQWEERPGLPRVRVVRPLVSQHVLDTPGNSYQEMFTRLFDELLATLPTRPLVWEYSPMMVYLAQRANPELVVYDCMDELANFQGAHTDLRQREATLMGMADLVFTGGRSMYEARKNLHPRVYCFPSGVDAGHYQKALDPATLEPADVAEIPHPRMGYFGVLDERIDWDLIAAVAQGLPDWHWIFVGPTAKIEPAQLPQAPNLHYLGQRRYEELPAYLRSFDVATMPFALNDATRYISPTKTLEYMAGHAPIVSTRVPDVVNSYGSLVSLADSSESFIEMVQTARRESSAERQLRIVREDEVLKQNSWDCIAERMWDLIEERLGVQKNLGPVAAT